MTQKTKAIILIVIILGATLFAIYYYAGLRNNQAAQLKQQELSKKEDIVKEKKETQDKQIVAIPLKGKVLNISKDSLEISTGEEKNTFTITETTLVSSVISDKIEKKQIEDVKKGDDISIIYNQDSKNILSIQIGKDAGSAF